MVERRHRHIGLKIFLILIIIVIVVLGLGYYKKYSLSDEKADLNVYYNISDGQTAIVRDDKISEYKGYVKDEDIFVPLQFASEEISSKFYYASDKEELLYVLPEDIIHAKLNEDCYTTDSGKQKVDYNIIIKNGEDIYLNIKFIKEYARINYAYGKNPSRIQITTKTSIRQSTINDKTDIRKLGGVKSPILRHLKKGEKVEYLQEGSPWTKIRTKDGFIGYVQKKYLKSPIQKKVKYEMKLPKYTSIKIKEDISLVWHHVFTEVANKELDNMLQNVKNVNVVAPTWFSIKNTQGAITSLADEEYVANAHSKKMQVWGVLDNINSEVTSPSDTLETLSNSDARNHIIKMVISEATRVGLDGINLDIELINKECGPHFIEFVRELSVKCRKNKIALSIDNYFPVYWKHYNHKEQGEVADYVVIMAYDEHGNHSDEVGSVSSIDFVRQAVSDAVRFGVPKEKLILGLPFFTRLWKVKGSEVLSNKVVTMNKQEQIITEHGLDVSWNEEQGQNVASKTLDDNSEELIWMEDEKSLKLKINVYKKEGLKGLAFWKLGSQSDNIWEIIK